MHREARTFDRRVVAKAWIEKHEAEIAAPGGLDRAQTPKGTLADAIDKYIAMSRKEIGRTKTQVLRSIKTYSIADMDCADIKSTDIIAFAEELSAGRKPQTVGNYISHLSAIFRLARPAWRLPLDYQAMKDAHAVLSNMGITSKSAKRDRRPTLAELDLLMQHFVEMHARAPQSTPMHLIVPFALFSTRRQEEITRIQWVEPPEALSIMKAMPRKDARIFPYTTDAIGAAFTRACLLLVITTDRMPDEKRLHFHDLRHEGISRLFEMGKDREVSCGMAHEEVRPRVSSDRWSGDVRPRRHRAVHQRREG